MFKSVVRKHVVSISILIYISIYMLIMYLKPGFLFQKNGSLREFGIGYRNKTIIPVWFIAIFISTLSYFSVMYYVTTF